MAAIVELREMSDEKLEEMLENAREEMFNLRFRHASSRLDDFSQLRRIRRDISQYETILQMRLIAIETAEQQPEIAAALKNHDWYAEARFDYRESGWKVEFVDEDGDEEIATALVNLNQKKSGDSRRSRRQGGSNKRSPVINFEVAG
ncbi:MAG: 50S ribosomal protein L29 [Candidatus Promineifilaceae bacterium]